MPGLPEPTLSPEELKAFRQGVEQFNQGAFFECHDTLEELWSGVRGPARDFFQGLIQVAVAWYHLDGGNLAGAESMLGRALRRFEAYPDRYFGFDLAAQRRELRELRERVRGGQPPAAQAPRWRFDPLPPDDAQRR